jgi:outer membrane immunogenic protein
MKRLLLATTASAFAVVALASQAISSQALAADLATRAPVYTKAPVYAPVSNWNGWYIGGNVGYGWGNGATDFTDLAVPFSPAVGDSTSFDAKSKGVVGGGQFGYNWQVGSFLAGLEADIQGSGVKGTADQPLLATGAPIGTLSSTQSLSWFGTVRGRLGFTVSPDLLLYGTGGLAYGGVDNSASIVSTGTGTGTVPGVSVSDTRTGWAAGGGAEWMFTRGWSAKVEYLHIDLGNASALATQQLGTAGTPDQVRFNWRNQFDTVRFGVNYHFN